MILEIQARLQTLGYPVYDTVAVNADGVPFPTPYYVLYGGLDGLDDGRLTSGQATDSDASWGFTVRSVAVDSAGARRMSELARGVLLGWTPAVAGRACRVGFDGEHDPTRDTSVVYQDADYTLTSSRA